MQPRDIGLLKNTFRYGFLTGEQIKNLCGFGSVKRTNDRLRKMFDNRYLSRRLFLDNLGRRLLYFPGPKAIEIVAADTGLDPLKVKRRRTRFFKMRDSFLPHFLSLNNFRFSLEMAAGKSPQPGIEAWKYKQALFSAEEPKIFPDAYFRLRSPGKVHNFFLEIDRSLESRKRIGKKIEAYLDYGLNGDFERQFGFKWFRLLIVSRTPARLRNLLRVIQGVTDKSFCLLTLEANILPERILSPVWSRSNREGLFPLIE